MKSLSSFIFLAALLITTFGCGQKGKTTQANMTLVAGFAGTVPGQTGGTMLLGYNPQTGRSFSKTFDGAPMELPNGFWDFAAITWDGNSVGDIMQGQVRCAVVRGIALNGGETNVNLNLSTPNCSDPLFGIDETKAVGGEPLPILPTTCTDQRGVYDTFEAGTCKNSTPTSYRIIFPTKRLDGATGPGLVSTCVDEDTLLSPELDSASSAIKVPIVLPGPWEFPLIVDLYDAAGCASPPDRVVISNPYTGAANRGAARLNEQGSYIGVANELRISKNPCTSQAGLNPTPFSPAAGEYALCTADQIDTFVEANLTDNYELYSDIDFSGVNFTDTSVVQGTFEGQFDGRGRSISNVTISNSGGGPAALFRQIDGTGNFNNDEATIKNLDLFNFNITTNAPSNGSLVGNVLSGSQISRVSASNITITITAGADGTGGLIGKLFSNTSAANSGNTNDWSSVRGAKLNNVTIINNSTQTDVGGIVGIVEAGTALENSFIENVTLRTSSSTQRIGGAVGNVTAGAQLRSVKASTVYLGTAANPLHTSTIAVGGLVGRTEDSDLVNSKADNVYVYGGNSKIGGLIGEAVGGNIDNVVGDMDVIQNPSGGDIGGLIGYATNSATPLAIMITQARSFGSISCSGVSCGGLIGTFYVDSGSNTVAGSYSEASVSSTNNNVGGLIGQANNNAATINIIESAAFSTVSGATDVGGLVGQANGVTFTDSFAQSYITGTGATNAGFVGSMNGGSFTRCYSKPVLAASNANYEPFVNGFTTAPGVTDVYYVHPDTDSNIGGGTLLSDPQSLVSTNFANFDFTAGAGPWIADGSNAPKLKAVASFRDLGGMETGSDVDPIILNGPSEWNAIKDKPQLMDKVFRLGNHIDFGMGTFFPIGSPTNKFVGRFQGNNREIRNINYTDTSNDPVGLFRVIGVSVNNGATEIEHENPFNYDDKFKLYIRNVSITKDTGTSGHAGILAGAVIDNGDNAGGSQFHDYNKSIKISGIEIYDSYVYGGRQTTISTVGGLIGNFIHTNGQSELRDIRLSNTEVYSGNQNVGTGGMIGRTAGPLNATSTPPLRDFGTFIADGLTVQATGGIADKVGGLIGSTAVQTANWNTLIVSNTDVSGNARVGGIFGDIPNAYSISEGSFSGTVSAATVAGGIVGWLGAGSIVDGFISKATVSTTGVDAACVVARGVTNPTVRNSIGHCPSVTGGGNVSYFGNAINGNPTPKSIYTGPGDEGLGAGIVHATAADYTNPTFLSTNLSAGNPWIIEPGVPPVPYWVIFPEALEGY